MWMWFENVCSFISVKTIMKILLTMSFTYIVWEKYSVYKGFDNVSEES
jgi:hypothetical protein